MEEITKIVKSLEESRLLIKEISVKIKNEAKEQKGRFLGMFLNALAASLLGSALTRITVIKASEGTGELVKIFNAALPLPLFWNTKILSKWT